MNSRNRLSSVLSACLMAMVACPIAWAQGLPYNDECAGAVPIVFGPAFGDTLSATTSTQTPNCGATPVHNDLWYQYLVQSDGDLRVETVSTWFHAVLTAFRGDCSAFQPVPCNGDFWTNWQDGPGSQPQCQSYAALEFPVTAGELILISVGGTPEQYSPFSNGPFAIAVELVIPPPPPVPVPCLSGGYLAVDPIAGLEYASVPSAASLQDPDAITIDARFHSQSTSWGRIVSKGDGANQNTDRSYDLSWLADGRLQAEFFLGPQGQWNWVPVVSQTAVPQGQWGRVTATFDRLAGEVRLYVNGVLDGVATTTSGGTPIQGMPLRASTLPLTIGATPPWWGSGFRGAIDEVRIYSRALPPAEIIATSALPLDGLDGLEACFHFDSHLHDLTGGHVATLEYGASLGTGCAVAASYGKGKPGSAGAPVLAVDAAPVLGQTANLTLTQPAAVATAAVLLLGIAPEQTPALGGMLLVTPSTAIALPVAATGLTLPASVPSEPALANIAVFVQAFLADGPAPGGVAISNGLALSPGVN